MPAPAVGGGRTKEEMKCPKCSRVSLKRKEGAVSCTFCHYVLSPGEEVKFRLYEMLKQ